MGKIISKLGLMVLTSIPVSLGSGIAISCDIFEDKTKGDKLDNKKDDSGIIKDIDSGDGDTNNTETANPKGDTNKHTPKIIKVKRVTYSSLGITGDSGSAIMTTPPSLTSKERSFLSIDISKVDHITNGEEITISFRAANIGDMLVIEGENSNPQPTITFRFPISNLRELSTIIRIPEIKIKPNIIFTGVNGQGTFTLPQLPNIIVTSTQTTNLSNGDLITLTFTSDSNHIFSNNSKQLRFQYQVYGLSQPIIDLTITKPNITLQGDNGQGVFTPPRIPHTTVAASKTTSISNGETITITYTADRGYTISGQSSITFSYTVKGLTPPATQPTSQSNVSYIVSKKQGYDVNDIHVQKVIELSGSEAIIGYFGSDYRKSPVVFQSHFTNMNPNDIDNAPSGKAPYFQKSEMEQLMRTFLTKIVHGPELPTIGLITFDAKSMVKQHVLGWQLETGLNVGNETKYPLKYKPQNNSKAIVFIDTNVSSSWNKSTGASINYNDFNSKFGAIYSTLQHEYGHGLSNVNTVSAPTHVEKFMVDYPDDIYRVGLNNGYRQDGNQKNTFLAKTFVQQLGVALGVDWSANNNYDTTLTTLLEKRHKLLQSGASTQDVEKKLSLWTLRVMLGQLKNAANVVPELNRDKAFLWPGQVVNDHFSISYFNSATTSSGPLTLKTKSFDAGTDYSTGFSEMITRLLTFLTSRSRNYWDDQLALLSLMTGLNPYYKYKDNYINLSNTSESNFFLNQYYPGGNGFKKDSSNTKLTIFSTIDAQRMASPNGNLFDIRQDNLNRTKLKKLTDFYKNDVLGHDKVLSLFKKNNNNFIQPQEKLAYANSWSLNLLGGWTPKKHQYIIGNQSDDPNIIATQNSVAYELNDSHGVISFRGNGSENYTNRTLNDNTKIAWYLDFSGKKAETEKYINDLIGKKLSFWDDLNGDSLIQPIEITPILWNETKNVYKSSEQIFTGGISNQNNWFKYWDYKGKYNDLYNSPYDLLNPVMLTRLGNGVTFKKDDKNFK